MDFVQIRTTAAAFLSCTTTLCQHRAKNQQKYPQHQILSHYQLLKSTFVKIHIIVGRRFKENIGSSTGLGSGAHQPVYTYNPALNRSGATSNGCGQ
jgi:hypothetical protein